MIVVRTGVHHVTYLGARAIVTTQYHEQNVDGLRTVTIQWIDAAIGQPVEHPAGTVTRRVIRGDGRCVGTFTVVEAETVIEAP